MTCLNPAPLPAVRRGAAAVAWAWWRVALLNYTTVALIKNINDINNSLDKAFGNGYVDVVFYGE
jgi:hypothetical protein